MQCAMRHTQFATRYLPCTMRHSLSSMRPAGLALRDAQYCTATRAIAQHAQLSARILAKPIWALGKLQQQLNANCTLCHPPCTMHKAQGTVCYVRCATCNTQRNPQCDTY
eukprot:7433188-Alexandrium_andersonii.AAC.1